MISSPESEQNITLDAPTIKHVTEINVLDVEKIASITNGKQLIRNPWVIRYGPVSRLFLSSPLKSDDPRRPYFALGRLRYFLDDSSVVIGSDFVTFVKRSGEIPDYLQTVSISSTGDITEGYPRIASLPDDGYIKEALNRLDQNVAISAA